MNCCIWVLIELSFKTSSLLEGTNVQWTWQSFKYHVFFWKKLLMDFILVNALRSPNLHFINISGGLLWASIIVVCCDWDPRKLSVYTNGPSLQCFEVFCWLCRSSALILMLKVSPSSSTTPQPFFSWLHLICCGLGNRITELIKIMSKIRTSRLSEERASCVLWTVWSP